MVPTTAGPPPEATPTPTRAVPPPIQPGTSTAACDPRPPALPDERALATPAVPIRRRKPSPPRRDPQLDPPLIRFTGGQPAVNAQVVDAAAEYGMFALDRPDLAAASRQLTARARAALALIDNEPATAALVTARPADGRYAGYSPPEYEALGADSQTGAPPDLRRSWTWTTDGPAPWDPLPNGFRVSAEEWTAAAMRLLTDRILPGLSRLVGFDLASHYRISRGVCRYNDYPAPQAPATPGQMRAGAHRDYGPLTLVVPDGPGLELHHAGRWLPVRWTPGQVLVNVGQELAALATLQGQPSSVPPALHRVTTPLAGAGRRSSLVCFWYGHPDTIVDYRAGAPVTSAQFMQRRIDAQLRPVPPARTHGAPR